MTSHDRIHQQPEKEFIEFAKQSKILTVKFLSDKRSFVGVVPAVRPGVNGADPHVVSSVVLQALHCVRVSGYVIVVVLDPSVCALLPPHILHFKWLCTEEFLV